MIGPTRRQPSPRNVLLADALKASLTAQKLHEVLDGFVSSQPKHGTRKRSQPRTRESTSSTRSVSAHVPEHENVSPETKKSVHKHNETGSGRQTKVAQHTTVPQAFVEAGKENVGSQPAAKRTVVNQTTRAAPPAQISPPAVVRSVPTSSTSPPAQSLYSKYAPLQAHHFGETLICRLHSSTGTGCHHVVPLAIGGEGKRAYKPGMGVWATNQLREPAASAVFEIAVSKLRMSTERANGARIERWNDVRVIIGTDTVPAVLSHCDIWCSNHHNSGFIKVVENAPIFAAKAKPVLKGECIIDDVVLPGNIAAPFVKVVLRSATSVAGPADGGSLRVVLMTAVKAASVSVKEVILDKQPDVTDIVEMEPSIECVGFDEPNEVMEASHTDPEPELEATEQPQPARGGQTTAGSGTKRHEQKDCRAVASSSLASNIEVRTSNTENNNTAAQQKGSKNYSRDDGSRCQDSPSQQRSVVSDISTAIASTDAANNGQLFRLIREAGPQDIAALTELLKAQQKKLHIDSDDEKESPEKSTVPPRRVRTARAVGVHVRDDPAPPPPQPLESRQRASETQPVKTVPASKSVATSPITNSSVVPPRSAESSITKAIIARHVQRRHQEEQRLLAVTSRLNQRLEVLEAHCSTPTVTKKETLVTAPPPRDVPTTQSAEKASEPEIHSVVVSSPLAVRPLIRAAPTLDHAAFLSASLSCVSRVSSRLAFCPNCAISDLHQMVHSPYRVLLVTPVDAFLAEARKNEQGGAEPIVAAAQMLLTHFGAQASLICRTSTALSIRISPATAQLPQKLVESGSSLSPTVVLLYLESPRDALHRLRGYIVENRAWLRLSCWVDFHCRTFEMLHKIVRDILESCSSGASAASGNSSCNSRPEGSFMVSGSSIVAYYTDAIDSHPLLPPAIDLQTQSSRDGECVLPPTCCCGFVVWGKLEKAAAHSLLRVNLAPHRRAVHVWQRGPPLIEPGSGSSTNPLRVVLLHDSMLAYIAASQSPSSSGSLLIDGFAAGPAVFLLLRGSADQQAGPMPLQLLQAGNRLHELPFDSASDGPKVRLLALDFLRACMEHRWAVAATCVFDNASPRGTFGGDVRSGSSSADAASPLTFYDALMDAFACWGYDSPRVVVLFYTHPRLYDPILPQFVAVDSLEEALSDVNA